MNTATDIKQESQQEALTQTQECVERLLETMGFTDVGVTCTTKTTTKNEQDEKTQVHVAISTDDTAPLLIGMRGEHLQALQHIIRSVLCAQLKENLRVTVDVNGYLMHRERNVQQLAEHSARKAQNTGRAVVLRPMTAFERRIVHTVLASRQNIRTESLGEEPNRRVIIKPVFM